MTYTMGTVMGGIVLGQSVLVRPAGDRYRDMYGGAVVIEVNVDGKSCAVALDSADALTLAKHLQLAAEESRAAYALAQQRRDDDLPEATCCDGCGDADPQHWRDGGWYCEGCASCEVCQSPYCDEPEHRA